MGSYRKSGLDQYKKIEISTNGVFKGGENCSIDVWMLRILINPQN